ncbi:MAG: M4 family metallopeptidase [Chlamydiae bacterium]|nr:M4 family metallopeptidase [Chlamydiota bacterium]
MLGKKEGGVKDYVQTDENNRWVHINYGIPNKAFYEAAMNLGGEAWEKAGLVWYRALKDRLKPSSDFRDAARKTTSLAGELFGAQGEKALKEAWKAVGIKTV